MKFAWFILLLLLVACGCTTRSTARLREQNAFLAGQNMAMQHQLAQANSVTIRGAVQNPQVPWVAGLTLAQALATANYSSQDAPQQIILTRQGESAVLGADAFLNGADIPLEPGDVVELRQ
jgi:hypothetical protein